MKRFACALLLSSVLVAQQAEPPRGKVLFERHETPAADEGQTPTPSPSAVSSSNGEQSGDEIRAAAVSNAWRSAVAVVSYNLDLHLNQSTGAAAVHAQITVRNRGSEDLAKLPLQISSSLKWTQARIASAAALPFEQHTLSTDADHTGAVNEAVFALPSALKPGETVALDVYYEGDLAQSNERLSRIGAPATQAALTDWDGFRAGALFTGVRGFGNVMWYPTSAAPVFLGAGNDLFSVVSQQRALAMTATMHLRLTLEYGGAVPDAAYLCGKRAALQPLERDPTSTSLTNFATASWDTFSLDGVLPSLFLAASAPTQTHSSAIDILTQQPAVIPTYTSAAELAEPVLSSWMGSLPDDRLTVVDLNGIGSTPYEGGTLLAMPLRSTDAAVLAPRLVHALTPLWMGHVSSPWLSEGLATFLEGVYVEHNLSRDALMTANEDDMRGLALYESEGGKLPLTECPDPVCYRVKGAAVWNMLRGMIGEDNLRHAVTIFRAGTVKDSATLEAIVERTGEKDLKWFFDDWVFHDRGLPDLSILSVVPRSVAPAQTTGRGTSVATPAGERTRSEGGWLTSVEVANNGGAAAEVPVTLRSAGGFASTERLRIAAHSHATLRMLTPASPTEVVVNDGFTPEVGVATHRLPIAARAQ